MNDMDEKEIKHYEEIYYQFIQDYYHDLDSAFESWIKQSADVLAESKEKKSDSIYIVTQMIIFQGSLFRIFLDSKSDCTVEVFEDIEYDIKSSFFLALHGRYNSAIALLRRWLETILTSIYFDTELNKVNHNSQDFSILEAKKNRWLSGNQHGAISGSNGVIAKLLDTTTAQISQIYDQKINFEEMVSKIYKNLCNFVHFGGIMAGNDLALGYSEFNDKRFDEWFVLFCKIYEISIVISSLKYTDFFKQLTERIKNEGPMQQLFILDNKILQNLKKEFLL